MNLNLNLNRMAREDCIKEESLATLHRLGGDALVKEMIGIFLDFVPKKMDQVMKGQAAASLQEIEKGAHAIKSSAANVGAWRLQELASQIELTARQNTAEPLPALLQDLQNEFKTVCESLKARCGAD